MKVKYVHHRPREIVPATGRTSFRAEPNKVYDVDSATARSLLAQTRLWEEVKPPPKKKESD